MKRFLLAVSILCLTAMPLFSQAAPTTVAPNAVSGPAATPPIDETKYAITDAAAPGLTSSTTASFGVWDLVRMIIILGLVIAAIYGVFWFIRRGQKTQGPETALIGILGSQGLPGNRWVHLITVQKQVFLIGSSDASVNLIAEITDQEAIDDLRLQAAQETPATSRNFSDILGSFFGGPPAGGAGPGASGSAGGLSGGLDFIRRQRKRLTKYRE